jgi:N-formylmaleamate deformylase
MNKTLLGALLFVPAGLASGAETFQVQVTKAEAPRAAGAMILIPGLASHGAVWDGVVTRFKDRYDCHVLTLAGFAGVPAPAEMSLASVRAELAAYIRKEKLRRPVLVGHSLGGTLALWLASAEPGLVGPLVIVDSVPFLPALWAPNATVESSRAQAEGMRQRMAGLSGDAWRKFQVDNPMLLTMVSGDEDRARVAQWGVDSSPRAVGDAMAQLLVLDLRPELARVESKALVLAALKGAFPGALATYERQYAGLARKTMVPVESARHFIMYDDAGRLLSEMEAFLAPDKAAASR